MSPHTSSDLPEFSAGHANEFLFGLAPSGVYPAMNCCQSCGALLPHPFTLTDRQSRFRRSTLCGTFRRLSPPRRYLAPCPSEPGLSSRCLPSYDNKQPATARPSCGRRTIPEGVLQLNPYFDQSRTNIVSSCADVLDYYQASGAHPCQRE